MSKSLPDDPIRKLIEIMKQLRSPDGCPWDQLQTPETLKPYLLEEAYEVLHAIDNEGPEDIKDELGDLLLQIVFLASIYEERNLFTIDNIAQAISDKLIRRHPHVFGESDEQDLTRLDRQWEQIKKHEKRKQPGSLLENVHLNLPALLQAQKISKKVARIGFDWDSLDAVADKLEEELNELRVAIKEKNKNDINSEFGDVLFTLVNIGRHLDVDSETSLLKMLDRFRSRFQAMERMVTNANEQIDQIGIDKLESYWQLAKNRETKSDKSA